MEEVTYSIERAIILDNWAHPSDSLSHNVILWWMCTKWNLLRLFKARCQPPHVSPILGTERKQQTDKEGGILSVFSPLLHFCSRLPYIHSEGTRPGLWRKRKQENLFRGLTSQPIMLVGLGKQTSISDSRSTAVCCTSFVNWRLSWCIFWREDDLQLAVHCFDTASITPGADASAIISTTYIPAFPKGAP